MVGKAYTMKELRTIVDYLKTRDAYGQIKGKKIWVDLESSSLTNRTWQSLKEAFLKRILPDIVNPYYKLSREEIASFRVGHSMIKSKGNKLDVKTIKKPNKNNETITTVVEVHNKPTNNNTDAENNDVEEITDTNTNQASTGENTASEPVDTLNSNNCYKTAQDIIKDLLSSTEDNDEAEHTPPPSSPKEKQCDVKETTSPLNPVLRGILHDFDSDSSEIVLTIDENVITKDNGESIIKTGVNNENNLNENKDESVEGTETDKPTEAAVDDGKIIVIVTQSTNDNNSTNNAISGDSILPCNQEILSKIDSKIDEIEKVKKSKRKLGKKKDNEKTIVTEIELISDNKIQNVSENEHESDNELLSNIGKQPVEGHSTSKDAQSAIADNDNDDLSDADKRPAKKAKTNKVSITKPLKRKNKDVISADKEDVSSNIFSDNERKVENIENNKSLIEHSSKVMMTKSLKRKNEDRNTADKEDTFDNIVLNTENNIDNTEKKNSSIEDNNNKSQDKNGTEETNVNISKPPLTLSKVDEEKDKLYNPSKVILLPSHSESSESEIDELPKRAKTKKSDRLSRLFGFSSDALNFLMPNTGPKVRTSSAKALIIPSSDSDSDTDAQEPSIIKWKPEKGPPLENQIFVVYNGKLYPLIKKMDNVTSYCQYQPREVENESFWQKKFIEEKKLSAELARLLQETDENNSKKKEDTVTQKQQFVNRISSETEKKIEPEKTVQGDEKAANAHICNNEEKTVIKFKSNKDDSEITLEGRWQNLQPILSEVVHIFHGDSKTPKVDLSNKDNAAPKLVEEKDKNDANENKDNVKSTAENKIKENETKSESKKADPEASKSNSSNGLTKRKAPIPKIVVTSATPSENAKKPNPGTRRMHDLTPVSEIVDEEAIKARKRVMQLEADIFKEIEEKDKLMNEQINAEKKSSRETSDSNVNSRKRRLPIRYSKEVVDNDIVISDKRLKLVKDKSSLELPRPKRKARSTKKSSNETNSDVASVNGMIEDASTLPSSIYSEDSDTKYKFPSPEPEPNDAEVRKQALASMKNKLKHIRRKNRKNRSRHSNKANTSFASMDSLQDSDSSDNNELSSDRKKMSISMRKLKYPVQEGRRARKTSSVYLKNNGPNTIEESNVQVSNLDSKIYRTESYELLMNNKPVNTELYKEKGAIDVDNLSPATQTISGSLCSHLETDKSLDILTLDVQGDNSTNASCPTSPELSIVENISINTELMDIINSCGDINAYINDTDTCNSEEFQDNVRHMSIVAANMDKMDQKFDIIETSEALKQNKIVDESMPSVIRETPVRSQIITRNMKRRSNQTLSDTMLNKIKTVDINEPTVSESLSEQICNMVIDSAKKQKSSQGSTRNKQKPNSRSSTPHRKKRSSESNTLGVVSVIDECMEYCTLRTKRNSCPPNIVSTHDDESQKSPQNVTFTKNKGGSVKKKNVLKVKIVRPKHKKIEEPSTKDFNVNLNKKDVSIPNKVHNNSKSCASQKYLEDESVILVEQSNDSVITVNSFEPASCAISDKTSKQKAIENDCFFGDTQNTGYSLEPANCVIDDSVLEVNIDNAMNKSSLSFFSNDAQESAKVGTSKSTLSNNSLLTEDISDEILNQSPTSSNSKWYLFSEDEISNMSPPDNTLVVKQNNEYIKKLFPVVCEVPDLSTITEASHDLDNLKNNKESM